MNPKSFSISLFILGTFLLPPIQGFPQEGTDADTSASNERPQDPSPGQEADTKNDTILLSFREKNTNFSLDSMYINVLRIVNRRNTPVTGELSLTKPRGWDLIGGVPERITVQPGDTAFLPVRMSIPSRAVGGGTYVLNAEFHSNGTVYTANSYTTIPKKTEWNINIENQTIFFNQYREFVTFDLKISNKGNSLETLKLNYDVGEELSVDAFQNGGTVQFVDLSPHSDTTITHKVRYRPFKSKRKRFNIAGWRSKAINVKASTSRESETESVWFRKLESHYEFTRGKGESPLNLGIRGFNFLSGNLPRLSFHAFGNVLFPRQRELDYRINANNILVLDPNRKAIRTDELNRRTFFNIRYEAPRYTFEAGDRIRNNMLHYLFGTTARFEYEFSPIDRAEIFGSRSRFHPTYGGGGQYHRKISNNYSVSGGLVYEDNALNNMQASSIQVGQNFSFQNDHEVDLDLIASDLNYRAIPEVFPGAPIQDTATTGFGYRFRYQYDPDQQMNFSLSSRNMMNNPVNRFGRSYWRANGNYRFDETHALRMNYNRNERDLGQFPENFFNESGFSRNQNGQVLLNFHQTPKKTYFVGPRFASFKRKRVHPEGFTTVLLNPRYTLQGGLRYRIDPARFISPRVGLGFSNTFLSSGDTSETPDFESRGDFVSNASLTYNGNYFQFQGSYRRGPVNLTTADLSGETPSRSATRELVLLRPDYVREFMEGKYRMSLGLLYMYQLPNQLTNLNFRARGQADFDGGWKFSLAFNFSSNSSPKRGGEGFRTTRSTNMMFRITKSFDIPQPRIKYYDLNVVFFEDQNGDGKMNETESPVANVLTKATMTTPDSTRSGPKFPFQELISSTSGKVSMEGIPEGTYKMRFQPLENLNGLYFKNGAEQTVVLKENTTFYVPLVETYKVKGKIQVDRARYSKHDELDLSRIRVTATDTNGNEVSTLTEENGSYILDLPGAGTYDVSINNVLGKDFIPVKTRYHKIQFNGVKSINLNFKFKERSRDINFSGGNERLRQLRDSLGSGGQQRNGPPAEDESTRSREREAPSDQPEIPEDQEEVDQIRDGRDTGSGDSAEEPERDEEETRPSEEEPSSAPDTTGTGDVGGLPGENGDLEKDSYEVLDSLVGEMLAKGIADQGQRQKVIEQAMKANQSSELAAAFEPDLSPDTMADPLDSARVGFLIDLGVNPDETSFEEVSDLIDNDFTRVDTIAGGRNRYTVGPYDSFESALQRQKELRDQGFEQTYMIGSYNDQRIRLEDALEAKGELGD